jgi:hypothetical protein
VRRRAAWRTVVVGLLALAACSSAEPAAQVPSATVTTAPATTATTDPYAVPAVIDAAYVNRVLAGLDAVNGDVVRLIVQSRTIPKEAYDRLRAIYQANELLDRILDTFSQDVAFRLSTYRMDPGNMRSTVTEVLSASTSCIYAKVSRDYSSVAAGPAPTDDVQWVGLRPLDLSHDPARYNGTGWAYTYEGYRPGRLPPSSSPCASL